MRTGLPALQLPDHGLKTMHGPDGAMVFDPIRRKWVALLPEEWVRQHFIHHLIHDQGCPASLITVETALVLNELRKRADVLVHDRNGRPVALVECKAPDVRITQATFEQAARYNAVFKVAYLIITNGLQHYCCLVHHETAAVKFLVEIPAYEELCAPLDRTTFRT